MVDSECFDYLEWSFNRNGYFHDVGIYNVVPSRLTFRGTFIKRT